MMETNECDHSQHWGMESCPGLSAVELAYGEKVRSVALNFIQAGGREQWHGRTVKEQRDEIFSNAEKYGNPPPESQHRKVLV